MDDDDHDMKRSGRGLLPAIWLEVTEENYRNRWSVFHPRIQNTKHMC
jgi:hypothetical protein